MLFESPSLSRAETAGQGTMAIKAELGKKFNRNFNGTTDGFTEDSIHTTRKYKGNFSVEQGDIFGITSLAFRFLETGEIFLQGEMSSAAGISSSVWLLGLRSEMEPGGVTPFLEGGIGLLDVYVHSVIDKYKVTGGLFDVEEREYLGTERIEDGKFLLFPHISGGLRARAGSGLNLIFKARTLYLQDGYDIGTGTFLNSAGAEVELAVFRHLFVNATTEITGNTIDDGEATKDIGIGLTLRL